MTLTSELDPSSGAGLLVDASQARETHEERAGECRDHHIPWIDYLGRPEF